MIQNISNHSKKIPKNYDVQEKVEKNTIKSYEP